MHERLRALALAAGATLTAAPRRAPRSTWAAAAADARGRGAGCHVRAEWLYDSVSECAAQRVESIQRGDGLFGACGRWVLGAAMWQTSLQHARAGVAK